MESWERGNNQVSLSSILLKVRRKLFRFSDSNKTFIKNF